MVLKIVVRYKYTEGTLGLLTDGQRQFFEDNGYIILKNNMSDQLIDRYCNRFEDICSGKVKLNKLCMARDPLLKSQRTDLKYVISKLNDFHFDDILREYIYEKAITDVVADIIGPNISVIHSNFINKCPNATPENSEHPLHQDLFYFPIRPADYVLTTWTALEKATKDNGCLYVIPGTHKGPIYNHTETPHFLYRKVATNQFDDSPKVYLEMNKGDTVFFHSLLLHGSLPNRTNGFRKSMSCHYVNNNCFVIDVRGTFLESLQKDIQRRALLKGQKISYREYWILKSRLIRGDPGNLQRHFGQL